MSAIWRALAEAALGIKIDQSFVRGIAGQNDCRTIARVVIGLDVRGRRYISTLLCPPV